jgi:putative transcriptional regulator
MNYAELLKALREKLLLTQTELAKKLGVSYVSINRWENGKNIPSIKAKRKIVSLCRKYGILGE